MAPQRQDDDDWSDSDEERLESGGIETSVLLGIPDGPIDVEKDLIDAAVSRIGGLPALLPRREPPITSSHCKACAEPMELLVQMWCPFENSPMDRALYIWGCARGGCQGKDGSVRAWRGLKFNEKYAVKLERKKQREIEVAKIKAKKEQAAKQRTEEERKQRDMRGKPNPFSMGAVSAAGTTPFGNDLFGKGAQIFGIAAPSAETKSVSELEKSTHDDYHGDKVDDQNGKPPPDDEDSLGNDADSDSGSDSEESLLTALASTELTESPWRSAPAYPPLYMSTAEEYLPPQATPKPPKNIQTAGLGDDDDKKEKGVSWAQETYEDSLEVDHVFERFTTRVGWKGNQCVRYELGGTPLPFASDKIFDLLWPRPPQDALPVTKPDFKVVRPVKREYCTSSVPPCPACGSARVFECQLMPNLIYVLRPAWAKEAKKMTDEERRKTVERALKRQDTDEKGGMEWGTCMVFSCEKDCCTDAGGKESWREEVVYIQWDE